MPNDYFQFQQFRINQANYTYKSATITMKLEYIADNTDGGKFPDAWPRRLIRMFDFDEQQNQHLIKVISEQLLGQHADIELTDIAFITSLNCRLLLRLSAIDKGISELSNPNSFACDLTESGYLATITAMRNVGDGYDWLDNISEEGIEFLYSAGGTW